MMWDEYVLKLFLRARLAEWNNNQIEMRINLNFMYYFFWS